MTKEKLPITEIKLEKCTKSELITMVKNQEDEIHDLRKSISEKNAKLEKEAVVREKLKEQISNATIYICLMERNNLKLDLDVLKTLMGGPVIDIKTVFESLKDIADE